MRRGKKPGIYTSWPECQKQVAGFANARFKGFMTREEALAWLQQPEKSKPRAV
ncbi:MAG: RNase H1/viroplasmin domain-containing protein, partial [Lactobacillus sp.]|nr:RNase H1/viroplasmin domain-containing protein [Lactobacillus sp.]